MNVNGEAREPVDSDCQPGGFGLDLFECPSRMAAYRDCSRVWRGGPYRRLPMSWEEKQERLDAATPRRVRRAAVKARRRWLCICLRSESQGEAEAKYRRWAAEYARRLFGGK